MNRILRLLEKLNISVLSDECLSRHCTWRIGGPADLLIQPGSVDEIKSVIGLLTGAGIPWIVVGRGSNLLFDDEGVRGAVIKLGRMFSGWNIQESVMTVKGGTWVPLMAKAAASAGLSGLEHLIGIPGNLGGLVTMNGGSLRQNIGQVVERVRYMNYDGEIFSVDGDDCGFSYRRSVFQDGGKIVLDAALSLIPSDVGSIRSAMAAVLRERKGKFPLEYPNCGSVFSNDPNIFSLWGAPGRVVETCGLKGFRVGDIQISEKHANFAVNLGKGKSKDVIRLIRAVRHVVRDVTGCDIPCEVRYVSPGCEILPLHLV